VIVTLLRNALPFRSFGSAVSIVYGGEFVNETMIHYCLGHGIELTRSRPYRKNDQASVEQKKRLCCPATGGL